MTERARLKSGAEVVMTEGRTEGSEKRETCHTNGTTVKQWITQKCARSNNLFSSRCIGIVHPVCTCARWGEWAVIVCICCKALHCVQKWSNTP